MSTTVLRDHIGVRSIDYGTIWVCQCCMLSHANGECCPDSDHGGDGIEPWSDTDDRWGITAGMRWSEHDDGCPNRDADACRVAECDCEHITFSMSSCDGCGSTLAGDRHAHTLWRERRRFVHRPI